MSSCCCYSYHSPVVGKLAFMRRVIGFCILSHVCMGCCAYKAWHAEAILGTLDIATVPATAALPPPLLLLLLLIAAHVLHTLVRQWQCGGIQGAVGECT